MADSSDHENRDAGEEEEEEIDATSYKTPKDAVLFAIDVSESMLRRPPPSESKKADQDSATSAALKCAYSLMQQRIISNPNDMMGIILFGTQRSRFQADDETSDGRHQYPHCYLLADLDKPAASDVKRLRSLVEDEEESKELLVPSDEPAAMANLLFCANQIFTTKAANFSSRRLFLVTDNGNPHGNNKNMKSSSIVRAKDLFDLGVAIELFPISQPGSDFDTSKFYDDIVYRPPSDPEAPAPISKATRPSSSSDGISLLTSLLTSIHSKMVPKRALFSNVPLEFSPDLRISVKGYIIFKRQEPKRSCYVWLDGETPRLAFGETARSEVHTARPVEKTELRKAFKFGGESVLFTPEELTSLRTWGDPVVRLIGFKPLSMLPIWANVRPSTFIYPSEEDYVGSTRTFSALQQTLLEKQKMGLVWYIPRRNAAPVIAALLPGAEKLGDNGEQTLPPGMWLVPLPFADDIRSNPEVNMDVRAPDILKDKMREVIQQLQLPKAIYDPARYPNPTLQWHYRILQALALDEDLPDKAEDKTIPRYKQIHKRAGPHVVDWGNELKSQFKKWQLERGGGHSGGKREALGAAGGAAKKAKSASAGAGSQDGEVLTDNQMQNHVNNNTVNKLTIPVLKSWLASKKLGGVGRKSDLVERVEGYFENKMQLD